MKRSSLFAGLLGGLLFGAGSPAWGVEQLTPQVLVESKFVEVTEKAAKELGLGRMLGALAKLPPDAVKLSPGSPVNLGIGAAPSAQTIRARLFPEGGESPFKLSGLLTDAQFQAIVSSLEQEKNVKIVSELPLTVPYGQSANLPTAYGSSIALEIEPQVGTDGNIQMSISPQVSELGERVKIPMIGQIPVLGAIMRNSKGTPSNLIVFITAHTIDTLTHSGGDKRPDKIAVETVGTGETIGNIADLTIRNLTDQPLDIFIPPLVLESKDGKSQDYVCPGGQTATVASRQIETVHMNGVCLNRDKPPVGKGVTGGLVINTVDPGVAKHSDCHIPAKGVSDLLRICNSVNAAVDDLLKDGPLKDFPYKKAEEQKNILVQWDIWTSPQISQITKSPPASKDDLKKVVYKQAEEKKPMSSETRKKIDKGIDTIFEKIELTSAKAKDLETPAGQSVPVGNTPQVASGQPSASGTPAQAAEVPRGNDGKLKWPKPIQAWVDKWNAAKEAEGKKNWTQGVYNSAKKQFFGKSKHHGELEKTIKDKQQQLNTSSNQEANDKLVKERDEAKKELAKVESEMEKDFKQTDEGKKLFVEMTDAQRAAEKANAAEKEAGKYLDDDTKKSVQQAEEENAVKGKW